MKSACICILVLVSNFAFAWTTPQLVSSVNTQYMEDNPFISADGKTLYFSRGKTDTFTNYRIYQATRPSDSGLFTQVSEISTLNNPSGDVWSPWVSSDNLRMYYNTVQGSTRILKMSQRASVNDPWTVGSNISELNALGSVAHVSLSADELSVVFACYNRPDGAGGWDDYIATRPNLSSPFGSVRNLIETNTSGNDWDPSISPDGLTLYWAEGAVLGATSGYMATRTSLSDPFSNAQRITLADSIGVGMRYPCANAAGTEFYFVDQYYNRTGQIMSDIYVSSIPEPATMVLLGIGYLVIKRKTVKS